MTCPLCSTNHTLQSCYENRSTTNDEYSSNKFRTTLWNILSDNKNDGYYFVPLEQGHILYVKRVDGIISYMIMSTDDWHNEQSTKALKDFKGHLDMLDSI